MPKSGVLFCAIICGYWWLLTCLFSALIYFLELWYSILGAAAAISGMDI